MQMNKDKLDNELVNKFIYSYLENDDLSQGINFTLMVNTLETKEVLEVLKLLGLLGE